MARKFQPFHKETITKELLGVPSLDRSDLFRAMDNFQGETGIHYTVKAYGDGLMMIKGKGSGRCLWFYKGETEYRVVRVYQKTSKKAPKSEIEIARARMRADLGQD